MATITTLRPSATSQGVGWTPSTATLHGVTSDDNDATHAQWGGDGSAMILATPPAAPPAGERRHLARVRARGEMGSAWWAVRLLTGQLVAGAAATFPGSPDTVNGSWAAGVPHDGTTTLSCYVSGESPSVRIVELYLDVDTRAAPTFAPQMLDGSGSPTTTVSDTVTPTARVSALDLDGLVARQYRFWVTDAGAAVVWDTGTVSGPPVDRVVDPLPNGTYTLHMRVWSTLGANTAYGSDVEDLAFTMNVGAITAPGAPSVQPVTGTPFFDTEVCAPDTSTFDDEVAWIQIQRVDCEGNATTIALLGPLEAEECATWRDFTIPRAGVGRSCDHDPADCCVFYRARTVAKVDGQRLVSDWSDAFNPGLAAGLTFAWPASQASIPVGWNRVTDLDSRYPKGIPTAGTQPGTNGGSATHTHTTPGHTHATNHSHASSGGTGTASASQNLNAGSTQIWAPGSHTHTLPATNTTTVSSQGTAPGTAASPNDPARLEVVWVASDGNPLGVPDGALGLFADIAPAGWDTYAGATGRFLKGAPGGNGGATATSELDSHTHTINSHTHSGTSHTHSSSGTGSHPGSNQTNVFGTVASPHQVAHSHPVTVTSASTTSLQAAPGGTSGSASPGDPPFRHLRVRQNTSGDPDLPIGLIGVWRGPLGSIPAGWDLCDGTNGTPDMLGRYPRGATTDIGGTGGGTGAHTHTGPGHSHQTSGHSHTRTVGATSPNTGDRLSGSEVRATPTHAHSAPSTTSTTPDVGSASTGALAGTTTEPAHQEVAFVQLQEIPEPPPEPQTSCLQWNQDEHLLRTLGTDGPLYAAVCGVFGWARERPFTAATGVMGGRFVTSAAPGGRNYRLSAGVRSEAELAALRAVLARPLVLVSPSDAAEVWAAPVAESVRVVKVGRVREVSVEFVGTGPEPAPTVQDAVV